jgi:hypothetical protein
MAIPNLLRKNVPRAELDERAREARVRLERLERLLVPRVEEQSLWLRPLVRLVSFRVERNARRSGQTGGSMSNPRGGCMPEAASVSRDDIGEPSQAAEATKSPVGAAAQRGSAGCGYRDHWCRSGRARPTRQDEPRTCLHSSVGRFANTPWSAPPTAIESRRKGRDYAAYSAAQNATAGGRSNSAFACWKRGLNSARGVALGKTHHKLL